MSQETRCPQQSLSFYLVGPSRIFDYLYFVIFVCLVGFTDWISIKVLKWRHIGTRALPRLNYRKCILSFTRSPRSVLPMALPTLPWQLGTFDAIQEGTTTIAEAISRDFGYTGRELELLQHPTLPLELTQVSNLPPLVLL